MELKSPKTPHPRETQHMPSPPPKNAGTSILQTPTSPNHVAEAGVRVSSPQQPMSSQPTIVPIAWLLHVELAHNLQSPGIPSHTQVTEPQSAMRCQGAASGARYWGPRSAMEAMNQSGQPRNSGKRGPMQPAPLTSGGPALEETTSRGWGPHLQHSFLINFF